MSRVIYVNGQYLPYAKAAVHVEDRGLQFADSVYEVMEVKERKLVDEDKHLQRLLRSMSELSMTPPMSLQAIGHILRETVRQNRVHCGSVYLQITRGTARRDFIFPSPETTQSLICIARHADQRQQEFAATNGISVKTMPDIRWRRPDIKSTALLPNVLAREAARAAGAREAWLIDDNGFITEGAASNAWIVTQDNTLKTRDAERGILRGVTRTVVFEIAKAQNIKIDETAFTIEEALGAKEAFVTAATAIVMPVVRIDDTKIGDGQPGELTRALRRMFHKFAQIEDSTA